MAKGLTLQELQAMGAKPAAPASGGLTLSQIQSMQGTHAPLDGFSTVDSMNPIKKAATNTVGNIVEDLSSAGKQIEANGNQYAAKPGQSFLDRAKNLALNVSHNVGAMAGGVVKAFSEPVKTVVSAATDPIVKKISDSKTVQDFSTNDPIINSNAALVNHVAQTLKVWTDTHPETTRTAADVANLAQFLLLGLVPSKNVKDIHPIDATKEVADIIGGDIKKAGGAVADVASQTGADIVSGAKSVSGYNRYVNAQAEQRAKAAESFVGGDASDASTAKFSFSDAKVNKIAKDITSSDSTKLFEDAIKEGALKKEDVYASGDILTKPAAQGRIDDVAAKLDQVKPGLGAEYKVRVNAKPLTMKNIVDEGHATLANAIKDDLAIDPVAKEAIKQGIDEGDIALIKSSSEADKVKMKEMLNITEKAKADKTVLERSTDVSGKTFADPARHIKGINDAAGKELDTVAKTELTGQKVDLTNAYDSYLADLEKRGVTVADDGSLDFANSDFDGLDSVQKSLERMHKKFVSLEDGDAYNAHQVKRFIDEQVDYGKSAEGLTGGAERIVKNFRHNVDAALDEKFPAYNEINTKFAETRNYLDELQRLLGKNTPIADELAPAKAGTLMRRVLSNAGSRTDIMRLIANTEELAKKYGFEMNESILHQVLFADTIEKMLGTEAPTGLMGQVERGVKAAGAVKDLASGNILGAATKGAGELYNKLQGISPEAKIEALRKLLGK